jgi:hypothetical protein
VPLGRGWLAVVRQRQAKRPRIPGEDLSWGGADFGPLAVTIGVEFMSTLAVAATLNAQVVTRNMVVFITMGERPARSDR